MRKRKPPTAGELALRAFNVIALFACLALALPIAVWAAGMLERIGAIWPR